MLQGKTAVIYGGGGAIGGAVARAFAREGARVHLTGRTLASVQPLADEIGAVPAAVDALDEAAVDAHADAIGPLDISFNAITHGDVQGTPMHEMDVEDYLRPVATAVRSTFLTMRAAARQMIGNGGGTILIFGGEGDPPRGYHLGGLQTAFHALEAMRRQLSVELGAHGVRVVTLRSGGVPESLPPGMAEIAQSLDKATLLGHAATFEDVGNAAVFAASEWGRAMTGATINISCGTLLD
jgi:NAD(P)-dependent dehydrogenase (short-subunit alcohol dehydrogenase family)